MYTGSISWLGWEIHLYVLDLRGTSNIRVGGACGPNGGYDNIIMIIILG